MPFRKHKENIKKTFANFYELFFHVVNVLKNPTKLAKSEFWAKVVLFAKGHDFYLFSKKLYLIVVTLILFFTVYHIGYARKVIPGIRVGDIFIGGLNYPQAVEEVSTYEKNLPKNIKLLFDGKTYEIKGENLLLTYNVESSVSRAFDLGRSGNVLIDLKDKLASLIKTIQLKLDYDLDSGRLSNEFSRIKGEINVQSKEASFRLVDNKLEIDPSIDGLKVNDQQLYDTVISSIEKLNFKDKKLQVETINASLTKADLEKVQDEVNKLVFNKIELFWGDKKWTPSPAQMLEFVHIDKNGKNISVSLDKSKFQSYVDVIKQEVNELPRGNVLSVKDNLVTSFEVTRKGKELDTDRLFSDFKDAFLNKKSKVELHVTEIAELPDASKYGIFSVIGEGNSKYAGSIIPRVNNLTLAAARIDGVIVPPQGVFSFNNSVGEINAATGYDTAYIISNGRTVLGEGGGVCQTSTTLFRAALNAGLPIVTRHPHAYRVGYYEQDSPAGIDASVYQPSLDFQFKNDTPNHILIQASWDTKLQTLNFKIYGTPDGRLVTLSTPIVSNLIPPPEPLYQDDPTLEKGKTKQVDWAAWGAQAVFTRKVVRGDKTLYEDIFKSSYQPWRSIFMVGTKD